MRRSAPVGGRFDGKSTALLIVQLATGGPWSARGRLTPYIGVNRPLVCLFGVAPGSMQGSARGRTGKGGQRSSAPSEDGLLEVVNTLAWPAEQAHLAQLEEDRRGRRVDEV